jgi:hypothetical protein
MKLVITVLQPGHKPRTIESKISDNATFEQFRQLLEAEMTLNGLVGCDLRFHINVSEEE